MNILILFTQPWRVGGAETHVEALLKGLDGHKLFLAVNEGSNESKLAELHCKFPQLTVITIQARGVNLLRWRRDIAMLCSLVSKEHIDVISAQQRTAGIWAHIIGYYQKVPYTVTMHDPWHRAMFKQVYAKMFKHVFAVSRNLAAKLVADFAFTPAQIHTINNGIDFHRFKPLPQEVCRQQLGLDEKAKIILHVSRLSSVKGAVALTIIESMPHVLKKWPEARLIIIGEGPLRSEIDEKIAVFNQQYGAKISIGDFVDNISSWYNAADVLVGEGRVAMETLACIKPVVAVRNAVSFIGAITRENIAYACDVNFDGTDNQVTAVHMADEINTALQLAGRESEQIAAYIKERLSIENMGEAYLNVFNELVQEKA